jgi:NADPH:quinone reductase-like Zn-dependent oxidoreductase
LGSDLAGVVVEVGSRVTRFKAGDAVFASIFDLGTGSLAEFAVVPESAAALQDYDVVLGTVRGDALMKSLRILKPNSTIVSLIGPPDAAFARARGMNFVLKTVFGLLSSKIIRHARKTGTAYSFLFEHPDGGQLAEIGKLLKAVKIRPVIDKVFPFDQVKEARAYLEKGQAKGKVVVQLEA